MIAFCLSGHGLPDNADTLRHLAELPEEYRRLMVLSPDGADAPPMSKFKKARVAQRAAVYYLDKDADWSRVLGIDLRSVPCLDTWWNEGFAAEHRVKMLTLEFLELPTRNHHSLYAGTSAWVLIAVRLKIIIIVLNDAGLNKRDHKHEVGYPLSKI
jgi:hypothetical protein